MIAKTVNDIDLLYWVLILLGVASFLSFTAALVYFNDLTETVCKEHDMKIEKIRYCRDSDGALYFIEVDTKPIKLIKTN